METVLFFEIKSINSGKGIYTCKSDPRLKIKKDDAGLFLLSDGEWKELSRFQCWENEEFFHEKLGPKFRGEEARKVYSIRLEPSVRNELVKEHGSLTTAIEHLIKTSIK